MNPFGALSFSGLVKTFIPGFFIAFSLYLICKAVGLPVKAWTTDSHEVAAILIVVGGFALGLLSNTVVFRYMLDWLVRKPWSATNADLMALEAEVQKGAAALLGLVAAPHVASIDAEAVLIDKDRLNLLVYWMDRYWSYMEFDLNMLIAMVALSLPAYVVLIRISAQEARFWVQAGLLAEAGAVTGALALVGHLLLGAARRNYDRHKHRMVSLQCAGLRTIELERAASAG